jgi:hypothetical protein
MNRFKRKITNQSAHPKTHIRKSNAPKNNAKLNTCDNHNASLIGYSPHENRESHIADFPLSAKATTSPP